MKEIADYCEKIKQEFDSRLKWAIEGNDLYLELVTDIDKHKKMLDDEISTKLAETTCVSPVSKLKRSQEKNSF